MTTTSLRVGLAVAVGVLEEEDVGRVGDPDAAVADGDARGDVQPLGEDGELVGLAVAVGVFEDLDAVPARPGGLRGILEALGDPDPAPLVERHRDRVDDVRLAGDELDGEALGHRHLLDRLLRRERRPGRLVLGVGDDIVLGARRAKASDDGENSAPRGRERLIKSHGDRPRDRAKAGGEHAGIRVARRAGPVQVARRTLRHRGHFAAGAQPMPSERLPGVDRPVTVARSFMSTIADLPLAGQRDIGELAPRGRSSTPTGRPADLDRLLQLAGLRVDHEQAIPPRDRASGRDGRRA